MHFRKTYILDNTRIFIANHSSVSDCINWPDPQKSGAAPDCVHFVKIRPIDKSLCINSNFNRVVYFYDNFNIMYVRKLELRAFTKS